MLQVCPRIALLNHSCVPNCQLKTVDAPASTDSAGGGGLCLAVVARRQISAGEELCHAYIDRGLSREQRRQTLLSKYCFACECERCRAE